MPHITQKDIAKELGVTRITVSKALSQSPDISFEMRKKGTTAGKRKGLYTESHREESSS